MALTKNAKEVLEVALAGDKPFASTEIATAIDANTSSNTTNAAAIVLNTAHRTSDGKNHSDVVLNNAHRVSDGKNHSDVVLNNTHRTSAGTDHSDVGLANAHRVSDGKNHSDVVLNNAHRVSAGGSPASVAEATQVVADTTANSTDGDYFDITAQSGNLYRVYLDTTGANAVIPAAGGRTLVRVDLSAGAGTAAANADLVAATLNALADFVAPATGTGTVVITDANFGVTVDAVDPGMANLWAVTTTVQGAIIGHADVILANTHRTSSGTDHSDVVLNNAARNVNWKLQQIRIATANDNTTDATALGVVAGDFVIENAVDGAACTGSGLIVAPNTTVGNTKIGNTLTHYKPIV
jgi:hypothetical protein